MKTNKLLQLIQQKNTKRSGGALPLPKAQQGLNFLQPNSSKLKEGYAAPSKYPSTELATSIGGENGEPAYLVPSFKYGHPLANPQDEFYNTGDYLGGPFKTWQEADEWDREIRHPYVERGQPIPSPLKWWGEGYKKGGSLPIAQAGGVKPFITSDPNLYKQRLQAYNDSVYTHNLGLANLKYAQSQLKQNVDKFNAQLPSAFGNIIGPSISIAPIHRFDVQSGGDKIRGIYPTEMAVQGTDRMRWTGQKDYFNLYNNPSYYRPMTSDELSQYTQLRANVPVYQRSSYFPYVERDIYNTGYIDLYDAPKQKVIFDKNAPKPPQPPIPPPHPKEYIDPIKRKDFSLTDLVIPTTEYDEQPIRPEPVPVSSQPQLRMAPNPKFNVGKGKRTKEAVVDELGNPRYVYYNGDKVISKEEYSKLWDEQNKFAQGGSLPKAQDGTIDPYVGMRKFYDDAYSALDKYKNKEGEISPFNVNRAWAKAAIKNPYLLFRNRHNLAEQGIPLEDVMSKENNPYHKDSPVIRINDTETRYQHPTDYVVPNKRDVARYNKYLQNQNQPKGGGFDFDLSDEWKDIKRGVRNASRDVRHFIGKEIPRALRNCVNGNCYEFHQDGGSIGGLYDRALEQYNTLKSGPAEAWNGDPANLTPEGNLNLCLDCINIDWENEQDVRDANRLIEEGYSMGTHESHDAYMNALKKFNLQEPVYNSKKISESTIPENRYGGLAKAQFGGISPLIYTDPAFIIEAGKNLVNKMFGSDSGDPAPPTEEKEAPAPSDFDYNDYLNKANTYLSRPIFEGAKITGDVIANAAKQMYDKSKYVFPLDLLLSQLQFETMAGKKLKSKNNFFNVGNYDNGATLDFKSPLDSVNNYMDLMYNNYFLKGKKAVSDLLQPKSFVNAEGKRYASNPDYEKMLSDQIKVINKRWKENNKKQIGGSLVANSLINQALNQTNQSNVRDQVIIPQVVKAQKGLNLSHGFSWKDVQSVKDNTAQKQREEKQQEGLWAQRDNTPQRYNIKDTPNYTPQFTPLQIADLATDVMQMGHFVPHPIAQYIGLAGDIIGAPIDAYQAGQAKARGDYNEMTTNLAFALSSGILAGKGYRRDMWNTTSGSFANRIARLGSREGTYIPLTAPARLSNNPVIQKGIMFNKGLLLNQGLETAYDSQYGEPTITPSNQQSSNINWFGRNPQQYIITSDDELFFDEEWAISQGYNLDSWRALAPAVNAKIMMDPKDISMDFLLRMKPVDQLLKTPKKNMFSFEKGGTVRTNSNAQQQYFQLLINQKNKK